MNRTSLARGLSALALAVVFALPASAQTPSVGYVGEVPTNSPNHFYYAQPGEIPTRVSVWGTVRAPGTYFVRPGVDLAEVLSLAGGPLLNPRSEDIDRDVTIRVYRMEGDQRILSYEEKLIDMIAEPGAYPALQNEDVVEVETVEDRRWTFRDTVTVIGAAATSIVALERLYNLTKEF
ncbi:MAG: hypothetical protein AAFQ43_05500 [Bacteroidota bacterium]